MQLVCLGDSITDCNRLFEDFPLGNGYVKILNEMLIKKGFRISIKNLGADGFTVSRVLDNIRSGLFSLHRRPIVTLLVGINDVGLMMNTDRTKEQKDQMMQQFFRTYQDLLKLLVQNASKVIIMEPFIFPCPEEYRLWVPYVQTMSRGIQGLADIYSIPYIHLQNPLNELALQNGFSYVTMDGIHLTRSGHEILAEKIMNELFPVN